MPTYKRGNIIANYSRIVEDEVAKDFVESFFQLACNCYCNSTIPTIYFDITKFNDEIGYQITLHGYRSVFDPDLKFTKEVYNELRKKYSISIVFLDKQGKLTFSYSNRNYWLALLKNNIFTLVLLPIIVVLMFWLGNRLSVFLTSRCHSESMVRIIKEVLPALIGFPISLIAFKIQPMIPITKAVNGLIVCLSVFLYYFCTGNGLTGSLILLALFVLNTIKESLA